MPPRVTIAMPAFNEEHYIEACIASVQAQDYPAELIEILIADGRSTDQTRPIVARLTAADPRIKLVDNPARLAGRWASASSSSRRPATSSCGWTSTPSTPPTTLRRLRRHARAHRRGQRRRRTAREGQDVLPARAVCGAREPARRRRREVPLGRSRGPSSTPCSSARFDAACSRPIGLWDPGAITNEDAELTSASSSRAARSTCRATSSCTTSARLVQVARDAVLPLRVAAARARLAQARQVPDAAADPAVPDGRRRDQRCSRSRRCGRSRPPRSRATRWRPAPRPCASAASWGRARSGHLGHLPGAPRVARRRLRRRFCGSTLRHPDWPDEPERVPPRKAQLRAV